MTYALLIRQQSGKDGKTRVDQLLEWATSNGKEEFNGCVPFYPYLYNLDRAFLTIFLILTPINTHHTYSCLIFDEGHKAKKLVPEKEK